MGGSWTVPCKTNASISLTFGSIDFLIDPRDLAFIPLYDDEPNGDCWSGISIGTVGPFNLPTTWLVCWYSLKLPVGVYYWRAVWFTLKLGDTFLKNVYHSLNADGGKDEITFAKLRWYRYLTSTYNVESWCSWVVLDVCQLMYTSNLLHLGLYLFFSLHLLYFFV